MCDAKEFKKLQVSRFGSKIYRRLVNDDFTLKPENIARKGKGQELVKEQIDVIKKRYLSGYGDISKKYNDWAFDFPGWMNALKFPKYKGPVKNIMIVGLEPHVEYYDYQIVYSLFEYSRKKNREDTLKNFKIQDKGDGKFKVQTRDKNKGYENNDLWTQMAKLFSGNRSRKEIEKGNEGALKNILVKFYITDLCFFAPQESVRELKQNKEWSEIRERIAEEFLRKEIKCIRPKLIIAQGVGVRKFFVKHFKIKIEEMENLGTRKKVKIGSNDDFKLLCIPHISGQNNDFWEKDDVIKNMRREIKKHDLTGSTGKASDLC